MTTLNKQRMLSKLLLKVESKGEGFSAKVFTIASTETCITIGDETKRCEKAAAIRFFKYLKEQGYVGETKDGKGRCCIPQEYRENRSDAQTSWLKEVVTYNDPFKNRGRIAGQSPRKKVVEEISQSACFTEDIFRVEQEVDEVEETIDLLDQYGYDPVTGEFATIPEEEEVKIIGEQKSDKEDSLTQLMLDLAPLMERAKKLGIKLTVGV